VCYNNALIRSYQYITDDKQQIPKIIEVVENLASNPHPSNHKKLLGT